MSQQLVEQDPFEGAIPEERFVAFVDILGFGAAVLRDFDSAVSIYRDILSRWRWQYKFQPDVPMRIYSDALLLTSGSLGGLVGAIRTLNMLTLMGDCMIRGGIGYGKHIELSEGTNVYVVSEALTEAAKIEKTVRHPCVALSDRIEVPRSWWHPGARNLDRVLLYFDGLVIVNPLSLFWGQSAQMRAAQLAVAHPQHREKYEWFLKLTEAIFSSEQLVPQWALTVDAPNHDMDPSAQRPGGG